MHIPVIDISCFLQQTIANKFEETPEIIQVAKQIRQICIEHGFFYISNFESCFEANTFSQFLKLGMEFFETATEAEKQEIALFKKTKNYVGYIHVGKENLQDGELIDIKEVLNFGSLRAMPKHKYQVDMNVYPTRNELEFEQAERNYFNACLVIGKSLLHAFALSLGLARTYFDAGFSDPIAVSRIIHYPSLLHYPGICDEIGKTSKQVIACGAHSDYGFLTLLQQDDIGGLQLLGKDNVWHNVTPVANTLVVNLGDAMQLYTNHLYKATKHRVIMQSMDKDRYSIPFFFEPNYETIVDVLPTCTENAVSAKVNAMPYGDYLTSRYNATYTV